MARYFERDFIWEEYAASIQENSLPSILSKTDETLPSNADQWDAFYDKHDQGNIYKPRRYLAVEFHKYLTDPELSVLVEVGCGYGCSCFPLLEIFHGHYIATDCSLRALEILQTKATLLGHSITIEPWNIQESPSLNLQSYKCQLILCIFALSALLPQYHLIALQHMKSLFTIEEEGKTCYLLFRDYGLNDMTMFRHQQRIDEFTYQRQDQTYCHYFTIEYLRSLAKEVGFEVIECYYATVINRNRKTGQALYRVFVHGVFSYSSPSAITSTSESPSMLTSSSSSVAAAVPSSASSTFEDDNCT
jgi:hypothetical protein